MADPNQSIKTTPRSPAGQSGPGMEADTPSKFSRGTTPAERGEVAKPKADAAPAKGKKKR